LEWQVREEIGWALWMARAVAVSRLVGDDEGSFWELVVSRLVGDEGSPSELVVSGFGEVDGCDGVEDPRVVDVAWLIVERYTEEVGLVDPINLPSQRRTISPIVMAFVGNGILGIFMVAWGGYREQLEKYEIENEETLSDGNVSSSEMVNVRKGGSPKLEEEDEDELLELDERVKVSSLELVGLVVWDCADSVFFASSTTSLTAFWTASIALPRAARAAAPGAPAAVARAVDAVSRAPARAVRTAPKRPAIAKAAAASAAWNAPWLAMPVF
jgi:hypothetical protein